MEILYLRYYNMEIQSPLTKQSHLIHTTADMASRRSSTPVVGAPRSEDTPLPAGKVYRIPGGGGTWWEGFGKDSAHFPPHPRLLHLQLPSSGTSVLLW